MKRFNVLAFACAAMFFVFALPGCSDEPSAPTPLPEDREAAVEAILADAGKVVPLGIEKDDITQIDTTVEGNYRYINEKHDVVDNIESIAYLGLNDDVIWPGSLVKGDRAHDFVYEPISFPRAPITLSISLESSQSGNSITKTVDDPKLSTVRQGMADLLKTAVVPGTMVPARAEFSYQQVFNQTQMNLAVGAKLSYGGGSLAANFDWSSTTRKTKMLAKYKQIYYTIDIDPPTHPAAFISPTASISDIQGAFPTGSMPLYVAGVSYGIMAYMCIETNFSAETMNLAIDAAYKGALSTSVHFGYTAAQVLSDASIKVIVYGGSTKGLDSLQTGLAGFMNVISTSKDFDANSPGVPLVYKFRHLSDNTLALVTLTSQYTLTRPIQLIQRVKVTLNRFRCTKISDGWGEPFGDLSNRPEVDRLYFGYNVYNRTDNNHNPGAQINPGPYSSIPGYGNATAIYWYTDGGNGWQPNVGNTKDVGQSFYVDFDTEHYDFTLARLDLAGYARDWDEASADEHSYGSKAIYGGEFLLNGGIHTLLIDGSDVALEAQVTIELIQ